MMMKSQEVCTVGMVRTVASVDALCEAGKASKFETSDRRQLVNPNASFMRAFPPIHIHIKQR